MLKTTVSYPNAVIGEEVQLLSGIHQKSKNIAIYQRDIEGLQPEIDTLLKHTIDFRFSGNVSEIMVGLTEYLRTLDFEGKSLMEDIASVLGTFESLTQASSFKIFFATVETNMCRKFHTDINDLRLLCTYAGPGTVWLPDEAVNQDAIKVRSSNAEIVKDEAHIQHVPAGHVVILKGALYPDAFPIYHRSPSVEGVHQKRLLLRIDTNEFLNIWA